ncbi:leucine-rich repeat-containing protein [Tanacetum coccineum]|uniref:Leucine-rich repeat-containing protein n=1 Tax=Tanacetum coccineum TaxID=301880 RepID=A0ABQ5H9U2_9ASTR
MLSLHELKAVNKFEDDNGEDGVPGQVDSKAFFPHLTRDGNNTVFDGWKIPEFPWGSPIPIGDGDEDVKRFADGDEGGMGIRVRNGNRNGRYDTSIPDTLHPVATHTYIAFMEKTKVWMVFPESCRAMKQLQDLDLSGNEIHGQIPHWVGEIGRYELHHLNLSHNFITVLPQFQWYGLGQLYLQSNLIEGPFPPSICNMSSLRYLDMSHNSFDRVIPQCVGKLSNSLTMMDLGNNSFQGTIPNVFEEFKQLVGLILNGNQLEGGVPSSMSKCESLIVLDLGNNHLNGTFPGWLGKLRFLQVLVLKSNNFHGNIQPSFAVKFPFPGLQVLDLSHNDFVGQLPTKYFQNFNSMKNVVKDNTEPEYLDMGGKYYSFVVAVKGVDLDIPKLFVSLTIIDLSNNYFERGIPEIIGNLSALKVLNLSHNSLCGRIPDSLGKLREIESLDLSWNQLTGNIPQSLAGIKGLEKIGPWMVKTNSTGQKGNDNRVNGKEDNLNMGGGEGFDAEGDEDDSDTDTEEEAKEQEAIGKQEVAPPISNQVEATT